MPKKKGKKGKSKKGSKKKAAVAAEKEEVKGKTKIFLRVYQTNCLMTDSVPIPRILKSCRECLEEGKPLTKVKIFIINSHLSVTVTNLLPFHLGPAVLCRHISRSPKGPSEICCSERSECKGNTCRRKSSFCSSHKDTANSRYAGKACHSFPRPTHPFAATIQVPSRGHV